MKPLRIAAIFAASSYLVFSSGDAIAQAVNSREVFTPVDNDLALQNLRKFAGCAVDSLWKSGGECSDDRPIALALAYFNVILLIVATIFVAYTTYKSIADTANDGQTFGRSIDAKSTLLRAGAGAALALPIKSGFSLVQLLIIQVAIFASGAGDTLWNKVAARSLAGMYGSLPPLTVQTGDIQLRGNLAKALQTRIYGYVCQRSLQNYSKTLSGVTKEISPANKPFVGWFADRTAYSYYFQADPYYRSANNICGSINYEYTAISFLQDATSNDGQTAKTLMDAAQSIGQQAFHQAMSSIDASAQNIASRIAPPSNADGTSQSAPPRNDADIQDAIRVALNNSTATVSSTLASLAQSKAPDMQQLLQKYLDASTQNGWLTAVLWQRSTAAIYARMAAIASSVKVTATPCADITAYIPLMSRYGDAYRSIVDQASRDMAYVQSFDGYFASLASPGATGVASDDAERQSNNDDVAAWAISGLYNSVLKILSRPESSIWRDPILDAQEIGNQIAIWAAPVTGAAGLASTFTSGLPGPAKLVNAVSSFAFSVGLILLFFAFLLAGVAPFLILVHFFFAALHWFVAVAEALIAVPIWLLTKFMPAKEASFIGNSSRGYYFALGILLRPALIVVGFLAAILLMRIGIDIANVLFRGALALLTPDGTLSMVIIATAGIAVYCSVLFMLISFCASLISSIPDHVLGWIDAQVSGNKAGNVLAQFAAGALPATALASSGRSIANSASTMLGRLRNPALPNPGGSPKNDGGATGKKGG